MSKIRRKRRKKKVEKVRFERPQINLSTHAIKMIIIVTAIIMLLGCAFAYFVKKYTVDTIIVEGSTHYTTEEINKMVIGDGFLAKNSVILSLKYRNKEIKDVPFIETMSVRILSPTTIKITIYEKAVAGYVEYMGQYIYFDKDGTVVESSDIRTEGIPQIMGMKFDHVLIDEAQDLSLAQMTAVMRLYKTDIDKMLLYNDCMITEARDYQRRNNHENDKETACNASHTVSDPEPGGDERHGSGRGRSHRHRRYLAQHRHSCCLRHMDSHWLED